jgi:universal stress protein F
MKRILVCVDASPRAPLVLEAAADLARRTGARLSLLRTIGVPAEIDQELLVHSPAGVIETMTARANRDLAKLAETLPESLVEGTYVHVGTPWDTICREAKLLDVDLVLLGSHGYSGFDRILGTTAAKVVDHADRSVMVVRQRPHPR